jgi:hypothetical protein
MKLKLVTIVNSVVLFLVTSPLLAQADLGDDPDAPPAPIDDYVWVLALVGFIFIFMKLKAIQNKKIQN